MATRDRGGAGAQVFRAPDGSLWAMTPLGPGVAAARTCPTLTSFAAEYMRTRGVATLKPSSLDAKRAILEHHLVPRLGPRPLDQIGPREVASLQADLLEPRKDGTARSRKTVNNICTVLRTLLRYAVELELLSKAPRVPMLRAQLPRPRFLEDEQVEALIAGADADWRGAIVVALRTGLRIGELLALRWDAIDLDARELVARVTRWHQHEGTPKGHRERRIPLAPSAVEALRAHRPHAISPYVFCQEDGEPWTRNAWRWPLWRACDAAKLPRCGWHVLRHSFASGLVARGVPLRVVQELLGHTTIAMTERYAHASPRQAVDAVALLDRKR